MCAQNLEDIKGITEAAGAIIDKVPIYQDMIQPVAKQVGQSLELVGKSVNLALVPLHTLVWGYEKVAEYLQKKLTQKLSETPVENIQTPETSIAFQTIQAIGYTNDDVLREMFVSLLASSMDSRTASVSLPSFVKLLTEMSPDEARIIRFMSKNGDNAYPVIDISRVHKVSGIHSKRVQNFSFLGEQAGCIFPVNTPLYIDNLCRMRIAYIPEGVWLADDNAESEYDALSQDERITKAIESIEQDKEWSARVDRKALAPTQFGLVFVRICTS